VAIPGTPHQPTAAPPDLAATELFAIDAYRRETEAEVLEVDVDQGRVRLSRTVFFPGGGGQPHDVGTLTVSDDTWDVARVARDQGAIWHWLAAASGEPLPAAGTTAHAELDWERRHLTMRTHTALHILCGVIWSEFQIPVTGGNMEVGSGRLDFPLPSINTELGARMEQRINDEIGAAREIVVEFFGRDLADQDPALIRTAANLIPRSIDPLRVIDIVGLDKQADGGTHVLNTAEVGRVRVTGTESKGKGNKRIRLSVEDADA
jgi:misacylated tRNA(Ala) deacylase